MIKKKSKLDSDRIKTQAKFHSERAGRCVARKSQTSYGFSALGIKPPKAPTLSGKLTGKITSLRARYYAVILPKSLTLRELSGYLLYFVVKFFENR